MITALSFLCALPALQGPQAQEPIPGEKLDPSAYVGGWVETMDDVIAREKARTEPYLTDPKGRNGAQGTWTTPSLRWTSFPHSGEHYATAKWGDTRMGIGFGESVQLEGVWVAGHMDVNAWTSGVRAVGYSNGVEVGKTAWFTDVDETPSWFAIDLVGIDRVEFEAQPIFEGAGFYGLDDLTFVGAAGRVVVNFDDLPYRAKITGSAYAGLTWETGTGDFAAQGTRVVPPPAVPPGHVEPEGDDSSSPAGGTDAGTLPNLIQKFLGNHQGNVNAGWTPPDTCGAVGTTQFVGVVNENLGVWNKVTKNRQTDVSLRSFFSTGGSSGDPRVSFDPHDNRWIIICTDFNTKVRLA